MLKKCSHFCRAWCQSIFDLICKRAPLIEDEQSHISKFTISTGRRFAYLKIDAERLEKANAATFVTRNTIGLPNSKLLFYIAKNGILFKFNDNSAASLYHSSNIEMTAQIIEKAKKTEAFDPFLKNITLCYTTYYCLIKLKETGKVA